MLDSWGGGGRSVSVSEISYFRHSSAQFFFDCSGLTGLAGSTHGPTAESTTESGSSSQDQVNPTILEDMPEGAHEDDYEEAGTAAEPRGSKRKFRDVDGKDE